MAVESVKQYFAQFGREKDVLEFATSSATVELAAQAAGVIPARIAKTISLRLSDGAAALIVTAGDTKIDNTKYKTTLGCKAKMLTPEEALEATGHAVGGVCPFALPAANDVRVYVDESVKRFPSVFPACGSSNSAIELTPDELYQFSNALQWVDVCTIKE